MISIKDSDTIFAIAKRAAELYETMGMPSSRYTAMMIADEIGIVHEQIVRLRLDELLAADDFNLMHDVAGIHRHLDMGTRKRAPVLTQCFMPRFARTVESV